MKFQILLAALLALSVSGCASTPATSTAPAAEKTAQAAESAKTTEMEDEVLARTETSADDEDRVICRTIMPTGSHRKRTICRTVRQIKDERQSAQDALRTKQGATVDGASDL